MDTEAINLYQVIYKGSRVHFSMKYFVFLMLKLKTRWY